MIRPPLARELDRLRAIERAAGRAFVDVGMPEIAADEPPSIATLERYRAAGWAWVVTVGEDGGRPDDVVATATDEVADGAARGEVTAGYVIVQVLDDHVPVPVAGRTASGAARRSRAAHIEQVSVDPDYAGQGLGRRLLDHVAEVALQRGLDAVTLTTFRDVPWNAPYYQRCGFQVLGDDEIGPGLRQVRDHEAAVGLDPAVRVCMRRDLVRDP